MPRKRGNSTGSLYKRSTNGCYIASFYDHTGTRVTRSTQTTDRAAAQRILTKQVSEAALRKEGVIDIRIESLAQHAKLPIEMHLTDFEIALRANGVTTRQVDLVCGRLRRVINGCEFKAWGDITASRTMEYLHKLRRLVSETRPGISAQTFNFYLQAVKQFGRWMVKDRRAPDNPLAHLKGLNVRTDRRHDRRALSEQELLGLLNATATGPDRYGMAGAERALLYRLAVETGLQVGELASLTRSSFDLDSQTPSVTVEAAYSKRRRKDHLPLRQALAGRLCQHLDGKGLKAPAFVMSASRTNRSAMFREDREAAGIAHKDEAGRVVDFHALRHTFITNLAKGGVHPKIAQTLARHSTITLTMDRYTHSLAGDELAALEVLPDLDVKPIAAKATGTDCVVVDGVEARSNLRSNRCAKSVISGAASREETERDTQEAASSSALVFRGNTHNNASSETVGVGFEPTVTTSATPVFKTGPFNRSGTPPHLQIVIHRQCPPPAGGTL